MGTFNLRQLSTMLKMAAIFGPASLLPICSQFSCQFRFPRHSAHVGDELEIHSRWHPLYGQKVRYRDSERRGPAGVVHVDDGSGLVTMVPAWMLDPGACAGMKLGEPRVSVAALRELHHRLAERGLRMNSSNDSTVAQEECDESDLRDHSAAGSSAGRQFHFPG